MKPILLTTLILLVFINFGFSQETRPNSNKSVEDSPNVLESVNLRFDLEGNPAPEDVGFDNSKSNWKLTYELLLSDEKTVHDLYSKFYAKCPETTAARLKCVSKANKKIDKQYKKFALPILRGMFRKIDLSSESNRMVVIPVNFTQEVINILNKSVESAENPDFILLIKYRVSAKTPTKLKIKYKDSTTFEYPLKLVRKDGSFDFYNISTMGATIRVTNENNKLFYGVFKN